MRVARGLIAFLAIGFAPIGWRASAAQPLLPLSLDAGAAPMEIGMDLSRPIAMAMTANGGFYVADMGNPSVSRHERNGTLRWSVRASGRGPGDIQQPYRIAATADDGVLVYDLGLRDFSQFSPSGRFVRRFMMDVSFQILDQLSILGDGRLVVVGYTRDSRVGDRAIHIFSADGRWVRSFGPLPEAHDPSKLRYLGAGLLDVRPNGLLLFTRKGPYEILELDTTGTIVRRLQAPRSIGAIADSAVEISTNAAGSERISSRSRAMSVPLRTIALGNYGYLSSYAEKGTTTVAEHATNGTMFGQPRATRISLAAYDSVHCRLLAFQERDDEPRLVEIPLNRRPADGSPRDPKQEVIKCGLR